MSVFRGDRRRAQNGAGASMGDGALVPAHQGEALPSMRVRAADRLAETLSRPCEAAAAGGDGRALRDGRGAVVKQVVHFSEIRSSGSFIRTSTLCGRMSVGADGMNVTAERSNVTCKLCLRRLTLRPLPPQQPAQEEPSP